MAKPFIKWVGGKGQLLAELKKRVPKHSTYFEPFLGGGALFFGIEPRKSVLNDLNPRLINLYKHIQKDAQQLIKELKKIEKIYLNLEHEDRKKFYYEIREKFNNETDNSLLKSAHLLFLNRTCFNGVYRENASGKFNVPFGRNSLKSLFDYKNLQDASIILTKSEINCGSYIDALDEARKGDFVYLDPPYVPLSKTSSFTKYTGDDFGMQEQMNLRSLFKNLDEIGCKVMMSNSDTEAIVDIYKHYKIKAIEASRMVNCKADRRGKITELIITNY